MEINQFLDKQGITKYKLAKQSGVPYTTVNDICSGKARMEKCSAETIYKIAKTLKVTMEELVADLIEGGETMRSSFETYKSNVCHRVKDMGDIEFIIHTLETNEIRKLYDKKWYPECLYLLAMVDYLSRENEIPVCANYDDIRAQRLEQIIFPVSVIMAASAMKNEEIKSESLNASIPEFRRFNIVESEVRNVY